MSEIVERETLVPIKHYQVTFDEQEYKLFQKLPEIIRLGLEQLEEAELLGEYGSLVWKVMAAEPEEYPEWVKEEDRWHVPEQNLTAMQKVELAQDNHIWANAFRCIKPTPDFLQEVGQAVIRKLNQSRLVTDGFGEPYPDGRRAGESPVVYLRINKS